MNLEIVRNKKDALDRRSSLLEEKKSCKMVAIGRISFVLSLCLLIYFKLFRINPRDLFPDCGMEL